MGKDILTALFSSKDVKAIEKFYYLDEDSRRGVHEVIGAEILEQSTKFLDFSSLDVLTFICLSNSFGASEKESLKVAQFLNKTIKFGDKNPIPSILELNLEFSIKTLFALSFFLPKMEYRHQRYAAPTPSFYRNTSIGIFSLYGHEDIAQNHQKWESFFSERLLMSHKL